MFSQKALFPFCISLEVSLFFAWNMSTLLEVDDDNKTERTVAAGAFIFLITLDFCLCAPTWQAVAHFQETLMGYY